MIIIPALPSDALYRIDKAVLRAHGFLENANFSAAANIFSTAFQASSLKNDPLYFLYMSYYGLALSYLGNSDGLRACRHAAESGDLQAQIYANLTITELREKNRADAYQAYETLVYLNQNCQALPSLRRYMGVRKSPPLCVLSRDNFLNKYLGKLIHCQKLMH